jgi:hypothetical protein
LLGIAFGLGTVALILIILALSGSNLLARIPNSAVLIAFGIALLVGSSALARISASAYRLTPATQRIARISFLALGSLSLGAGFISIARLF